MAGKAESPNPIGLFYGFLSEPAIVKRSCWFEVLIPIKLGRKKIPHMQCIALALTEEGANAVLELYKNRSVKAGPILYPYEKA